MKKYEWNHSIILESKEYVNHEIFTKSMEKLFKVLFRTLCPYTLTLFFQQSFIPQSVEK